MPAGRAAQPNMAAVRAAAAVRRRPAAAMKQSDGARRSVSSSFGELSWSAQQLRTTDKCAGVANPLRCRRHCTICHQHGDSTHIGFEQYKCGWCSPTCRLEQRMRLAGSMLPAAATASCSGAVNEAAGTLAIRGGSARLAGCHGVEPELSASCREAKLSTGKDVSLRGSGGGRC